MMTHFLLKLTPTWLVISACPDPPQEATSSVSSLERKISTSTGQTETYSLASVIKEVVWIHHLLYEIRHPQTKSTRTRTDNQGVKVQVIKVVNHATAL